MKTENAVLNTARRRGAKKPTGYVLYENLSIVVIATTSTENPKTGNMVQVWILPADVSPTEAVSTGADETVCFDCKHRGELVTNPDGTMKVINRTCYVKVFQAPHAVWHAWRRGSYPVLPSSEYGAVFSGRKVRFGAYGEPVLIPIDIMRAIADVSDGWTGYTHQWNRARFSAYREFLMASCDSIGDRYTARYNGWRTFRVRQANESLSKNEIACPASDEMQHRTTCEKCNLCDGAKPTDARGAITARKDIAIIVHGSAAAKFISITAAPAAAAI